MLPFPPPRKRAAAGLPPRTEQGGMRGKRWAWPTVNHGVMHGPTGQLPAAVLRY